MRKTFCDACGIDITNECHFEVEVYDTILEKKNLEWDVCEKCEKKIISKLKEMFKKR